MKVSDFIVEYLISKGVKHVFGYPGGMVTHLMDSFSKYEGKITAHVTYHEQGAAFAACGYAQESGNIGVAYATSGPGATNLLTGICNAYFDSIPTLFITGQVNTNELKGSLGVRQRGFQETDIISMVQSVTKYAAQVEDASKIKYYLDYAFEQAMSGRRGPVLLDIPMNITRADICVEELKGYEQIENDKKTVNVTPIITALDNAKSPVFIVGNGIKTSNLTDEMKSLVDEFGIPTVTSMIAIDSIADSSYNYGFIGAYGDRTANFVVAKSDLIISFGSRLDIRQVGARREKFAQDAKIIRIDIDSGELEYKVHEDEQQINADLNDIIVQLKEKTKGKDYKNKFSGWVNVANSIKDKLKGIDKNRVNSLVAAISDRIPEDSIITTDVGQNQVWVAQSFNLKNNQKVYFSGGHGAMGYSLPAAIGCSYASGKRTYCFTGDGGLQMNIQELMTVARDQIPVKVITFNNNSLGMIRHFQEMYFENNFYQTVPEKGFTTPNLEAVAMAYGISYFKVSSVEEISSIPDELLINSKPAFIEVVIDEMTYVFPKLQFGKESYDQEPLLDRELINEILEMDIEDEGKN